MNTEDKLRRASREIDRVTSSVIAPPMSELRRSARVQGIGIALAAATAVFVLVGGAVLLLNRGGATTLDPAAPGVTTTTSFVTTTTGTEYPLETYVFPGSNPLPPIELDESEELTFRPVDNDTRPSDISQLRQVSYLGPFVSDVEIVMAGQLGSRWDDPRLYVIKGVFADTVEPPSWAGRDGGCYVVASSSDSLDGVACWVGDSAPVASESTSSESHNIFVGRFTEDEASVVVFEWGSDTRWQRLRGGYFYADIDNPDHLAIGMTAYDTSGQVIFADTPESATTTTALAALCSGFDIAPSALALSSIPQPLAETLGEIVDAARQCDFDRLAAIGGDNFTASFGGGDPSDLWTMEEEQGRKPMYWLLSILDLPYGTIDTEQGTLYVWPSAYAHQGSWETTPDADVEALRSVYSDEDMQGFADFGGYFGYRLGIWENGDWSFFVAGD